ncbi:MAG: squalene synthase HpnC [Carbonactinosporaceae bacterium]
MLAQARHENFPVASRLLPPRLRGHLLAVYGFARLVDDVGDEADGERGPLLDLIEEDLARVYGGTPRLPVLRRLAATVTACEIPREPLARLIAANRQDQVVHRYERYTDLLSYCELSANPVGHVVLHILGAATPERLRLSDRVCTALQLIEHWQDVAEDLARGRRYLPAEDLTRFGCREDELAAPAASPQVRALMTYQARRAATLLDSGAPLVGTLSGFARLATAGYVAGGRAALAAIAAADHDVLRGAPRPTRWGVAAETIRLVTKGGDGHDHGQPGG